MLHEDGTNVGTVYTTPGYSKYQAHCATSAPSSSTNNESTINNTNSDLLLDWHVKLGHLSMNKLKLMASLGTIPA